MHAETHEPVVVIMAKNPIAGRTKTRLCPPLTAAEAAALYEAMLRDTIALVDGLEGVQLAVAVTPPEAAARLRQDSPPGTLVLPVAGRDIGDCLRQVFVRLLSAGHPGALALNSDGPTLPRAYLKEAIVRLDHSDVVLGPSEDGGYYLIGLKQPRPELFQGITWSSAQVTAQTLARAAALELAVALLPSWYDVDTPAELERLRTELAQRPAHTLLHTRRFFAAYERAAGGRGHHDHR